jgi:hypothetical protein
MRKDVRLLGCFSITYKNHKFFSNLVRNSVLIPLTSSDEVDLASKGVEAKASALFAFVTSTTQCKVAVKNRI